MSEMVERVARVIYAADQTITSREMARAVIAAMREPTEGMINHGLYEGEDFEFNRLGVAKASFVEAYQRMIDEALK